jgi:hypothetical protein
VLASLRSCFYATGKATVLEIETTTSLPDSGEILCMNRSVRCPYDFNLSIDYQ